MLKKMRGDLGDGVRASVDGKAILVTFPSARTQWVDVKVREDCYLFSSVVLDRKAVLSLPVQELSRIIWQQNRETDLVAFLLDNRRRLVGRIEQPDSTLDPDELRIYLRYLARECDRLVFLLTGREVE